MTINRKKDITLSEPARIPTSTGTWTAVAFTVAKEPGKEHLAMLFGTVRGGSDLLTRVQSECLTGEVFGSLKCDCGPQLQLAMRRIAKQGRGIIVYLRQEGRDIGLFNKIRAYALQDKGLDTVEANHKLGFPDDLRTYGAAAAALCALGVKSIRLLSNDPHKANALESEGVTVTSRLSHKTRPTKFDRGYLRTKRAKLGHDL